MFAHLPDIFKVGLVWLAATGICLGWVHFSSQSKVPRSWHNSVIIALRVLGIVAISYAFLCAWLGLSADVFVISTLVVMAIACGTTLHGISANGPFEAAVIATIVLPFFVLNQFVLGFPEYDEIVRDVVLTPPDVVPPEETLAHLNAAVGTVDATMRPCGTVRIDGVVYPATTFDGKYLKAGTSIRVIGSREALLVVEASTPL